MSASSAICSWWYVKDGQRKGPVDDHAIRHLLTNATLGPDTLVWKEGMQSWQSARDVDTLAGSLAPRPTRPPEETVRDDTTQVFAEGRETVAGLKFLPENFAELWLRNEYMTNAELQQAWDNRHESEDAARWASRCVDRAMKRLSREAKDANGLIAGREATADYDAVASAVRGSSGGKAPEEAPPDLSHVSDQEFRDDVKKRYGFNVPI